MSSQNFLVNWTPRELTLCEISHICAWSFNSFYKSLVSIAIVKIDQRRTKDHANIWCGEVCNNKPWIHWWHVFDFDKVLIGELTRKYLGISCMCDYKHKQKCSFFLKKILIYSESYFFNLYNWYDRYLELCVFNSGLVTESSFILV